MTAPATRRNPIRGLVIAFLGMLAACFALGAVFGYLDAGGGDVTAEISRSQPLLWIAVAAVIAIGSFALGTRWMMSIDELAQRAHYEAWYWGGSIALTLMSFLIFAGPALGNVIDIEAFYAPLRQYFGEATGFSAGVLASMFALSVGYGAWWIFFWLRRR